jgi:predicted metal-dependent hydrolase
MLHLIEKNHNKNFVALMDMHMPDWRTTKEMLNGFVLDKYEGITRSDDDDVDE